VSRVLLLVLVLVRLAAAAPSTVNTRGPATASMIGPATVGDITPAGADWASSMVALWYLDEASGTRVSALGAGPLDLTLTGTLGNNTVDKQQGIASLQGTGDTASYLSTSAAAVVSLPAPFTCFAWGRPTVDTATRLLVYNSNAQPEGFQFGRDAGLGVAYMATGPSGTSVGSTPWPVNTWGHVAIEQTAPTGNQRLYFNGVIESDKVSFTYTPQTTPPLRPFQVIAGNPTAISPWIGQIDEVGCTNMALSAQAICRICSCGVHGDLCACNGTSYATKGRNGSNCRSCTLPPDCSAPLTTPTPSWVNSMLGAWMLDESGTAVRVNAQGNTAADLTPNVSISNDTTNKMEGAASALFSTDTQGLVSTAGAITNFLDTITFGCWFRAARSGVTERSFILFDPSGIGFSMDHVPANVQQIYIDTTVGNGFNYATPDVPVATWHQAVGRFDTGTVTVFFDGVSVGGGSQPGQMGPLAASTVAQIGNAGFASMWGQIDECWVTNKALSAAAICRICSCGVRGEKCACSGSSYAVSGRNASACGSCTLPTDCSASTPP